MANGTLSEEMQFWGQLPRHSPQPSHLPVMKYPSTASSAPPKENEALSTGFFDRSNHSPLPSYTRKAVRARMDSSVG